MLTCRLPDGDVLTGARLTHIEPPGSSASPRCSAAARHPDVVTVGSLVALPILASGDGAAVDLEEVAGGRAAVFVFTPPDDDAVRLALAQAASPAEAMRRRGARLFVIAREAVEPGADLLLIDAGGRFAYTLGLAAWDHRHGRARPGRAAALVLDAVGRVILAEFDAPPEPRRLLDCLPPVPQPSVYPDPGAW